MGPHDDRGRVLTPWHEWEKHRCSCQVCAGHHAKQKGKPFYQSPCIEGAKLHEAYRYAVYQEQQGRRA